MTRAPPREDRDDGQFRRCGDAAASTARFVADARRLGIHDEVAGCAIVRPAGSSDAWAWAVILIFSLLPLLAVVALIFLGSQVSNILNDVGNSVGQ